VYFNHTYKYIDDFLSINIYNFHNQVHLMYSDELKTKDTTESASYLDMLLTVDSNSRLLTTLYNDKRDWLNFPFLCTCLDGAYISQFIWYARAYENFSTTDKNVDVTGLQQI
jgi:hypothetical protein